MCVDSSTVRCWESRTDSAFYDAVWKWTANVAVQRPSGIQYSKRTFGNVQLKNFPDS
uniref:Uncharacterized protein n=1 Tax=Anguilla anguilla TaxID=7936 RepID=A0A0E9WCE4_ANGAN